MRKQRYGASIVKVIVCFKTSQASAQTDKTLSKLMGMWSNSHSNMILGQKKTYIHDHQ